MPKGGAPGDAPAGPTKTSQGEVPPIPTGTSSLSTAALAAGSLPGGRTLAIADQGNGPTAPTGSLQGNLASGTKSGNNTTLSRPEPIVQPLPRALENQVVPATFATSKQQPKADDPFLPQLQARGVTWKNVENVAGGVKFSCIVPNHQNPDVSRVYEAIGPDYPAAVRAVLWKIDQQK